MKYEISIDPDYPHLFLISLEIPSPLPRMVMKLPRWRPGRYMYADYAPNINDVQVQSSGNEHVSCERIDAYEWEIVAPEGIQYLKITYCYYANTPDAGGSYFDEDLFLLNPVNCMLYVDQKADNTHLVYLPKHYTYYCQVPIEKTGFFDFNNFQELADSPIIGHSASGSAIINTLISDPVTVQFIEVQYPGSPSIQGPQLKKLKPVLKAQVALFGDCPVDEYLFIFFPTRNPVRHGVEHESSSLLVMGPPETFKTSTTQKGLLELASHEFFHTWNVKNIRPREYLPYDFGHLVASPLHYVTEGITTYYGDLMIWKSGIWDFSQWLESINRELHRFYSRPARLFTSLRQASLDSAVNGYQEKGVPNRRISFYNKGYLVAMLLDSTIRSLSNETHSLDDVMRAMYVRFGKTGIGYTEDDFWTIVDEFSGSSLEYFQSDYIYGVKDLQQALEEFGERVGLSFQPLPYHDRLTRKLGIITERSGMNARITFVYPDGPGKKLDLRQNDLILSVDGTGPFSEDFSILNDSNTPIWRLVIMRNGKQLDVRLGHDQDYEMCIPQLVASQKPSLSQLAARKAWGSIMKLEIS